MTIRDRILDILEGSTSCPMEYIPELSPKSFGCELMIVRGKSGPVCIVERAANSKTDSELLTFDRRSERDCWNKLLDMIEKV